MHFDHDLHRHAVPIAMPVPSQVGASEFTSSSETNTLYRRYVKRALDTALILVSLPLVLPVLACLTLLVALQGGNPFFCQKRVGRDGKVFTMWKLRTMIPNADAALAHHLQSNAQARAEWKLTQKLKNDPRITALGAILRRTSLDELPQLLNVIKGEMSLVGPRPMLPEQQGLYPGHAYYEMLPGLTGFWQVSARNESEFAERAFFDARYYNKMSFLTDLKTLLATVRVVTRATGH